MRTIDITPTRDEHTRILAYVLCNVGSLPMVLADYWEPTEDEHERIRNAYSVYDRFIELAEFAEYAPTSAEKRKWARVSLKRYGFIK